MSKRPNRLTKLEQLYIKDAPIPDDLQEIRDILEEDGYDMSSADHTTGLQESLRPIREEIDAERRNARQRPEGFTKFRNMTLNIRDSVSLMFALLLFSVFPLVAVSMLFASEVLSAILGTATFMGDDLLEHIVVIVLGITITAFFFVLEWRRASLEYVYNQKKPKKYMKTLADTVRIWRYRLSRNPNIQRIEIDDKTEIKKTKNMARQVMILLVVLGILGRLSTELEEYEDITWHETIQEIVTSSNLNEFFELFAGGFIALILLNATSYILSMAYENFAEIGGDESDNFFSESSGRQRLIAQETQYMRAVLLRHMNKRGRYIVKKYKKMQEKASLPEDTNKTESDSETSQKPPVPKATILSDKPESGTSDNLNESNQGTSDSSEN